MFMGSYEVLKCFFFVEFSENEKDKHGFDVVLLWSANKSSRFFYSY